MNKWILLGFLPTILAAADPVVVRSSVEPKEAWQGQRVLLTIEVLGKDAWAQIPNLPSIQVSGAYVLPAESQGARIQEQIDGHQYSGQRYQLSIYPQRGGAIEVSELPVTVKSSVWGSESRDQGLVQAIVPKVDFTSEVPPGAEGIAWLVSTNSFSATQSWSDEKADLKVGDALKRSITLTASNVSGMAFKPLNYPSQESLGIYPTEPTVKDTRVRGSLSGLRKEEVTYIFEGAGTFLLPAVELVWWDLQNQQLKKVVLEGREVEVTGSATRTQPEGLTTAEQSGSYLWWLILLPIAGVLLIRREQLVGHWETWKAKQAEHEKVYFERFLNAVQAGDTMATQRALMQWLDRINTSSAPAQLGAFLDRHTDESHDVSALLENPTELGKVMKVVRNNWRKAQKVKAKNESLLPDLNG